jgi:Undecaprenyl-phosphate glucose phosphotransferase
LFTSVLRFILREIRRRGYNIRYMLIVGAGRVAGDIAARIRYHRELGFQLIGCLAKDDNEAKKGPKGIPIVGKYSDLSSILSKTEIDQIVIALPLEEHSMLPDIIQQIGDSLIDIKIVPDLDQFVSVGGAIEELEGLPVISVQGSPLEGFNLFAKRVLDLALSIVCLIVLSPLFLLIAILVKLSSKGPVVYAQERVSFDGSRFKIFKFRTMNLNAEDKGPRWATQGDERVTAIGKILRSLSLDELPQLFNVLRGDMSIVGPRPERPVFIEKFRARIPRYMLRHKVPAGMTGWAQIHGWRGDTSIDKRIEYDLYYIENWSLLLDLKILFLTLFKGFKNRNAY